MYLNYEKIDRDALYGCLLARLEKAERDTYKEKETREPNAIRYMSAFGRRPLTVSAQIFEKLNVAYLPKLTPGLRQFYRRKSEDVKMCIRDSLVHGGGNAMDKYLWSGNMELLAISTTSSEGERDVYKRQDLLLAGLQFHQGSSRERFGYHRRPERPAQPSTNAVHCGLFEKPHN